VTPASTGAITGTVTLSSASSTVGVVALAASAIPPGIAISLPQLSFSVTSVGTPSAVQTVTLKNSGTALPLTHLSIGATNPAEFPFTTNCPATLPAQTSCTISVTFAPTGYGLRAGIMNITADGGISAALPESGTASKGTPAITLASNVNTTMLLGQVTFTATVSSPGPMPGGTVNFMDGSVVLGPAVLSNGTASLNTSALTAGTHIISVVYGGDANYVTGSSNTVPEAVLDFSLKPVGAAGGTQTVVPGNSATYQVAITPTSGASFPVAATLTVPGLPQGATAKLNTAPWSQLSATSWQVPATTTLDNVSLTFHVPVQAVAAQSTKGSSDRWPPAAWGILLLPFAYRFRRAARRPAGKLAVVMMMAAALTAIAGLSGCGSRNGFFGEAPRTYTVTVTVTAGSVSHSTDLTLNVQ
jgi:hypothetical protein